MDYQNYIFPFLLLLFFGYRFYSAQKIKKQLPQLLKSGAIIIDVRSKEEFDYGSNPSSKNMPLNDLNKSSKKLDKNATYILCCASGTRSGMAVGILKKNGFKNVMNAGSWQNTILK